jgi:hypothetical protein
LIGAEIFVLDGPLLAITQGTSVRVVHWASHSLDTSTTIQLPPLTETILKLHMEYSADGEPTLTAWTLQRCDNQLDLIKTVFCGQTLDRITTDAVASFPAAPKNASTMWYLDVRRPDIRLVGVAIDTVWLLEAFSCTTVPFNNGSDIYKMFDLMFD